MAFSPFADVEVHSITDLKPAWFQERGIRLMLLDFDNTIVPYTVHTPTEPFLIWLRETRQAGVTVAVVSNSRKSHRVPQFCDPHQIPWMIRAKKPSPGGLRKTMEKLGFQPEETAMAGDQTFTDVIAANLAGVTSVVVYPIQFSNPFLAIRYGIELPFLLLGRKRRKT